MFWTSATDHWLVETMHDQETILAPNFLAENRRISNSSSGGALSKRSIPDSTLSLKIQLGIHFMVYLGALIKIVIFPLSTNKHGRLRQLKRPCLRILLLICKCGRMIILHYNSTR